MRALRHFLWTLVLLGALFIGYRNYGSQLPQLTTAVQHVRTELAQVFSGQLLHQLTTNETDVATTGQTGTTTPMESIVQGVHLSRTYYYRYSTTLPAAGRQVFAHAVATYNQTGVVHLVEGTAPSGQNQITFSVYHKRMAQNSAEVELGHGGPQITQRVTLAGTSSTNNASASLNADYSAAFSNAVATHELGHALGLDHSSSLTSVMYPISQGRSKLSAGDVAGLKAIYRQ